MFEPTSADPALPEAERLHPLFLLTGLGGSLRGLLGGYAAIGYLAVSGRLEVALIGLAALLAFVTLGVLLYWRRFEYRVGDSEIRIDSGILSRTHRSIPFDRIHDVDITQGPVSRLLGLARVTFETGSSGGGGKDEGVLQAIALERAEQIRALVRASRGAQAAVTAESDEVEPEPIFAMPLPRVLLAGVFNFSLALFAGLFGATQTFGDVLGFDPFARGFWQKALSTSEPVAAAVLQHRYLAAAAGAALLVLIGLATGVGRTLLREYGFRLDRTEVGLRRRRGLLTRTDVTLPVARAQAAIVATGPVRERFGWHELKLQSLARDQGSGDHVLAPLARQEEVDGILGQLGWRPVPRPVPWLRVSHAYIWTLVTGVGPLFVLIALVALVLSAMPAALDLAGGGAIAEQAGRLLVPVVLILVGLALAVLARILSWGRTGYLLDGDRLLVRSGWWRRRLVILPLARIQSIDVADSLVSRAFGVSSLVLGVAGGGGFSAHRIPALPSKTARALRIHLLS